MGESISSFDPSLTVTTTFKPSYSDMQIEKLIGYARDVDPFTGNLLHRVEWKAEPYGEKYKVHFKFSYYITEEQYEELQQFAIDFASDMVGKTEYEMIKRTHDYLVERCTYDINMDGPYNCVFKGRSNCNGYALAFYLIMQKCGIECDYVTGANHAWNIVKLGHFWYNMDVTWDDANNQLNYDYFLKGHGDWSGHDRNTATAGYEYDHHNALNNWIATIYYWCRWPVVLVFVFAVRKTIKKKRFGGI